LAVTGSACIGLLLRDLLTVLSAGNPDGLKPDANILVLRMGLTF
jgi:hypothetical protein